MDLFSTAFGRVRANAFLKEVFVADAIVSVNVNSNC
jgi:hypothetical protein